MSTPPTAAERLLAVIGPELAAIGARVSQTVSASIEEQAQTTHALARKVDMINGNVNKLSDRLAQIDEITAGSLDILKQLAEMNARLLRISAQVDILFAEPRGAVPAPIVPAGQHAVQIAGQQPAANAPAVTPPVATVPAVIPPAVIAPAVAAPVVAAPAVAAPLAQANDDIPPPEVYSDLDLDDMFD